MSVDTQRLIAAARAALHKQKITNGVAKRRALLEQETIQAEITLILDDLKAEGVDIGTAHGKAIATYVLSRKLVKQVDTDLDLDDFPPGW